MTKTVSIISTNCDEINYGEVSDDNPEANPYLKFKHFITLNYEVIQTLSKEFKAEDDEYINFTNHIDSLFCFAFDEDYTIRFTTEEDLCYFKLQYSNLLN